MKMGLSHVNHLGQDSQRYLVPSCHWFYLSTFANLGLGLATLSRGTLNTFKSQGLRSTVIANMQGEPKSRWWQGRLSDHYDLSAKC